MAKTTRFRQIKKRDGSAVPFDRGKIERAIQKAAYAVLRDEPRSIKIGSSVTDAVIHKAGSAFKNKIPTVEGIQDIVEAALMEEGYSHIAKAYILYREKRTEVRVAKSALGLKDDLKLPLNTLEVLRRRYLLKDDARKVIETPSELFRRVASHVAEAEKNFKSPVGPEEAEERFYHMMRNLEFMPNSPTLMNAATSLGQLSACFVIPVEDSIAGIFEALKDMATIHQTGGGTGFSFSRLRPQGDLVASTKGEASGPVSFMEIFDKATGVIVQGGRRRGANMGILRCDHPDIVDFVEAKLEKDRLSNFNISVGATDNFMDAVIGDKSYNLVNPRTGKKTGSAKARAVFDLIINAAWHTGDPGLIFLDEINRRNPTPMAGKIEATNPCGELPLLPYESCNLASVNLGRMVKGSEVDWEKLKEQIAWGIRFLDDVIEVNKFPLPQIRNITFANRKIGLGVMGFADMLIRLQMPYHSSEAVDFAERLMHFIRRESLRTSQSLAAQRGPFPNYEKSVYAKKDTRMRNATVNTVAPTGTISMIAGCSSGIEPLFAISFVRNVLSGTTLFEVNSYFEEEAKARGFYSNDLIGEIARSGSLKKIKGIPGDVKRTFVTAFDVTPQEHVQIQAACQKYTDNSVSKTINLPVDATVDDVRKIYLLAHKLKCKGITVYRYGSKKDQVLSFGYRKTEDRPEVSGPVSVDSEYSGGCATGY
ncbi:MAG: adenosylcobalamin-dependent ribonucleoside-diphosphate reductase [Deltaproteobacteria bacterium]